MKKLNCGVTLIAIAAVMFASPTIAAPQQQKPRSQPYPFVYPGEEVPEDTIRVTTLGSGSPDVRRHQVGVVLVQPRWA